MRSKPAPRWAQLFAAIATLSWASFVSAQAPSGSFQYQFSNDSGTPLYNFSGS